MIIYLYGPDSYRRNKRLREFYNVYKQKNIHIDAIVVDLEEVYEDWQKVRDFLGQPSMFPGTKVAIVKESGMVGKESASQEREWIRTIKKELESKINFILISDSGKPKKDFQFLLKEPVQSQEFVELERKTLEYFFVKEGKERGLAFSLEVVRFVCTVALSKKDRSWFLSSLLDQLSCAGFKSPIQLSDVQKLVRGDVSEEVFTLTGKLNYARSVKDRLAILERLFAQRAEGGHIFNSLVFSVRGEECVRLADYDVAIKSGELEYEEALTDFVISRNS